MVDKRLHVLSLFVPVEVAYLILKFAKEKKKKIENRITELKIKQPRQKHLMKYYHQSNSRWRAYSI